MDKVARKVARKDSYAMTIKTHQFDHLVAKLGLKTRNSRDLLAWLEVEVDGQIRKVARTRRSKGSGDLPMQHSIRQQLHLNEQEMRQALGCTLDREAYINILRTKGLL